LVVKNLLSNAIKYSRPRPAALGQRAHIQVRAEEHVKEVQVWVKDDGVGFDMAYVDRRFRWTQSVEDDEDSREIVALVLEQCGAEVDSADSALAQLNADPPTIIISDIGMPGTDGYAFIRIVRTLPANQGGDLPAIALTAFTREIDRAEATAAGFQAHVAKPVIPVALVSAIHRALGRT
jgi:CheY-like chemotaxis protein